MTPHELAREKKWRKRHGIPDWLSERSLVFWKEYGEIYTVTNIWKDGEITLEKEDRSRVTISIESFLKFFVSADPRNLVKMRHDKIR